jgi:hypothetical protein
MKKLILLPTVLLFTLSGILLGQPIPIKYGKIDTADLKKKVYDKDPTASAVILCDFGVFEPNTITFTRHLRLKIFKKEGTWLANHAIRTPTKSSIKGCTYNFVDGKIIESKLKDESIFREKVRDDYERFRVTMPDVVDGSIVELCYSFKGLPQEWRFQEIIPVEWSELRLPQSPYFSFNKIFFGFQPLLINTAERWVGKDMPALNEEPIMNSITNYLTKVEIELADITVPGVVLTFTRTWDDVNRNLMEINGFGGQIKDMGIFLNEAVKNIESTCHTPKEKVKAAFDYVKTAYKWNNECSLFTTFSLSVANKSQAGNSAEVNLILIKLLKKLDFQVFPVALSTRENGIISPSFPTIQKLNYVIALVYVDNERLLLDATEDKLPMHLLPERCLNGNGRIIDEAKSDWISTEMATKSKKTVYANLEVKENHDVQGTLTYGLTDYEALNFRKEYEKYHNPEEYISYMEAKYPGFVIKKLSINNLDSIYLPINSNIDVVFENQIDILGDALSINPLFFYRMTESPFKHEQRKYPVDYAYPREERYVIQINIPDGYIISELPKPASITMPDKKASYKYNIMANGNSVQLISTFSIDKIVFGENEYGLLREFYNQVIAKQGETIILRKAAIL